MNKKIKTIASFIASVVMSAIPSASSAQGITEAIRLHTAFDGGEFATASPDVSSVLRYGNCSLDLFHGRMGLRVPLFEYKDRDFTIPISLGYSTQGYQPGLDSGQCGMGWTLSCGGFITREVRGIPDDAVGVERKWKWYGDPNRDPAENKLSFGDGTFEPGNDLHNVSAVNLEGYYALWSMSEEEYEEVNTLDYYYDGALNHDYDLYWKNPSSGLAPLQGYETMSDIYHFNFLGISGDFVLQPFGRIEVFNCSLPSGCVTVEWHWGAGQVHTGSTFTIRTGDGMSYEFGLIESSRCYDTINGSISDDFTNITWLLTRVTAPNGRQAIFSYSGNVGSTSYSPSICVDRLKTRGSGSEWCDQWWSPDDDGYSVAYIPKNCHMTANVSEYLPLESVVVSSGMAARFDYDGGCLTGLSVTDSDNREVGRVSMSYSGGAGCPSFLKTISVDGLGQWDFGYLCEDMSFPAQDTYETDNLGFYNGSRAYTNCYAHEDVYGIEMEQYASRIQSLRSPNLSCASMGALCDIGWPSGGRSTVTYGLNKTLENGVETDSYGIRPESISAYDSDGLLLQRRDFLYADENGQCSGIQLLRPRIYYRYSLRTTSMDTERVAVSTQSSVGLGPKAFLEYGTVIERISGAEPSCGVAETIHRYALSSCGSLKYLTEYYLESADESAVGDGSWEYGYSDDGVPSEPHMAGSHYFAGREVRTVESDAGAEGPVSSSSREYNVSSLSPELHFPAMLNNRRCELVVNPLHVYCWSTTDSLWCSNGVNVTSCKFFIDGFSRPCSHVIHDQGGRSRTVQTGYVCDGSLIPSSTAIWESGVESVREMVDYINQGTDDSPWYLPSTHYRYDFTLRDWQPVNTVLEYDSAGNPTRVADAQENVTDLEWSPDGLHLIRRSVHSASGKSLETRWEWKPMVGMTRCEEPSGRVTEWDYDVNRRLIRTRVCGVTVSEAAYNISTESKNEQSYE